MKKKIFLIIIALFSILLLNAKVNADYTFNCTRLGNGEDEGYFLFLTFNVQNNHGSMEKCYYLNVDYRFENIVENSDGTRSYKKKDGYDNLENYPPIASKGEFDCSSFKFISNDQKMDKAKCPLNIKVDRSSKQIIWQQDSGLSEEKSYVYNSCLDYTSESSCQTDENVACVWVSASKSPNGKGYCNVDNLQYVKCGDTYDIPIDVPKIVSFIVNLLKIATPIILVIVSVITLMKALAAQKEDEIKKAQNSLIRKIIAAVLVFFVVSIVQFVILRVADSKETDNISSCLSCFLNNDCKKNAYYKTKVGATHDGIHNYGGGYWCTYFDGTADWCDEEGHSN